MADITAKDAAKAADYNLDICRIVDLWAAFRGHRDHIEIMGWDIDEFLEALRMPVFAIAEAARQRLQQQIDGLTLGISNLGVEPGAIELAPLPYPFENKTPAIDITGV